MRAIRAGAEHGQRGERESPIPIHRSKHGGKGAGARAGARARPRFVEGPDDVGGRRDDEIMRTSEQV